jgi:glycine cleavage system H protein
MTDTRFTDSHEWIRVDGAMATVGITKYAAEQLGDVVYVELPKPGLTVAAGAEIAVVESVKAASEIYAPASGEIAEGNAALAGDPAKVNADPEGAGWFFKMRLTSAGELAKLMTKDQYTEFVKGL